MELIDTFFNVPVLIRTFPLLIQGLWITLQLGVVSIIAGLVLGLALALMRLYAPVWVQVLAKIYINFMRSIPLLVLLIIIYHALPFVGIRLSPFMSAVSALSLVSAAHTAEIFHAGIAAIAKVGSRALPRWASTALGLNRTGRLVLATRTISILAGRRSWNRSIRCGGISLTRPRNSAFGAGGSAAASGVGSAINPGMPAKPGPSG